jgi:hypothetical protein
MVRKVWIPRVGSVVAALAVVVAIGAVAVSSAGATGFDVTSVVSWKQNAAPMGWSSSLDRIIYNQRGADGMFDAYSANPDGSDQQCLTCTLPSFPLVGTATNRGASDVSPDGRYMLVEVENGSHAGPMGQAISEPGKGAYNDVWLETTDGTQAWPLTNIAAMSSLGTIWARFDHSGRKIVWSDMYAAAVLNLGYWKLKVADIAWSNGVPSLANVQTIEPQAGHFYEPYGFSPDGSRIIFASDLGMPSPWDSQIYTIGTDGAALTRLSPADEPTGFFSNYNEFAFYTPDGQHIIYGRTADAEGGGVDYWVMNPDGTASRRLTYFNESWNTQTAGYTVVGGLAFDPNNPNRFIADQATDMNAKDNNAVMVNLDPPSSAAGLTGQYFQNGNLIGPAAATRVENPTNGFKWDAPPANGMQNNSYSIRWTGSIAPPASGAYRFCGIADSGFKLWLNNQQVIDGWWSFGARQCATVNLRAGTSVPVRMDYWHGWATAYVQLSWAPPGSGAGGSGIAIPTRLLAPAADAQTVQPGVGPAAPQGTPDGSTGGVKVSVTQTPTPKSPAKKGHAPARKSKKRGRPRTRSSRRRTGRRRLGQLTKVHAPARATRPRARPT